VNGLVVAVGLAAGAGAGAFASKSGPFAAKAKPTTSTFNGATDTRRGKTLRDGDVVCVDDMCTQVQVGSADDDYFDETTTNDDFDPEQWRNM